MAGSGLMKQPVPDSEQVGWFSADPVAALTRRRLIGCLGAGVGSVGLAAAFADGGDSALRHFVPRARRVIHLFMNGGPYQGDFFDPKPLL